MPAVGQTTDEFTIVSWRKHVGDDVKQGEVLLEVETDKAIVEVQAYAAGTVEKILFDEGATVRVGDVIAILREPGEVASRANEDTGAQENRADAPLERRVLVSPKARRLAQAQGIDLSRIDGTGPNGSIVEEDVRRAMLASPSGANASEVEPAAETADKVQVVQMSNMQKLIAARMSESKATRPHFYMSIEVDMENVARLKDSLSSSDIAVRLTYTPFIVKAAATALRDFPLLNARILGDCQIQLHDYVNVGVAVSTERGLVVPVVKNADVISVVDIARKLEGLISRARLGHSTKDDLSGGTFTVSNAGMYGVLQFAAVINPPESAILAVGAITKRPVVCQDGILTRRLCIMTVSADHRIADGSIVAGFLRRIKSLLETPGTLVSED